MTEHEVADGVVLSVALGGAVWLVALLIWGLI